MSVNNPILQQFITNVTNQTFTDATMAGAQWDFQGVSGVPTDGKFTTDNASTGNTTLLRISGKNVAGSASGFERVAVGNLMRFTDAQGKMIVFSIISMNPDEENDNRLIIGLNDPSEVEDWAGRFIIDVLPGS